LECQIQIGDPRDPEYVFTVVYLDYPKIRVNFNGFRIKTTEKNVNWSNYYMINEKSQAKNGLHLKNTKVEEGETIVLEDKKKHHIIGSDENCKVKTTKGGCLGAFKFLDDVGWVVQAKEVPKDDPVYGIYVRVSPGVEKFKLYQGMTLLLGNHLINIKELV